MVDHLHLDELRRGPTPEPPAAPSLVERVAPTTPGAIADGVVDRLSREVNAWVIGQGLRAGELMYELTDPDTGESAAVLALA